MKKILLMNALIIGSFIGSFSNLELKAQEYLPAEKTMVRLDVGYADADGLWVKKKFTDYEKNKKDNVDSYRYGLTWLRGFGDGFTVKIKGAYVKNKANKPLDGAVSEIAGLGDIGAGVSKMLSLQSIPDLGITLFTGFRTPGNQEKGGNLFLANSDGKSKYDFGSYLSYNFGKIVPSITTVYTLRQGDEARNQLETTAALGYVFKDHIYISLQYSRFETSGGKNLGEGGKFGEVDEDHSGYGATLQYHLSNSWSTDLTYYRKEHGTNTDRNRAINLGLSYLF